MYDTIIHDHHLCGGGNRKVVVEDFDLVNQAPAKHRDVFRPLHKVLRAINRPIPILRDQEVRVGDPRRAKDPRHLPHAQGLSPNLSNGQGSVDDFGVELAQRVHAQACSGGGGAGFGLVGKQHKVWVQAVVGALVARVDLAVKLGFGWDLGFGGVVVKGVFRG